MDRLLAVTILRCLVVSFLAVGCVVPGEEPLPSVWTQDAPEEESHSGEHGVGTQAVNVFVGGSSDLGDLDGFTLGVDYAYRVAPAWGVGGFLEAVTGLDRSYAAGVLAYWHAIGELNLVVGPGVERHDGEWGGLVRVGVVYEFPLDDGWVLSPALFYDILEDDNLLVYGVNVGYAW